VLKHKITSTTSRFARRMLFFFFALCATALAWLWGISWLSSVLLFVYYFVLCGFLRSVQLNTFSCLISKQGNIEIQQPVRLIGKISGRSFYNTKVMMMCVTQYDELLVGEQHNKPKKWFVVFNDSVSQQDYRLLARLIVGARWA